MIGCGLGRGKTPKNTLVVYCRVCKTDCHNTDEHEQHECLVCLLATRGVKDRRETGGRTMTKGRRTQIENELHAAIVDADSLRSRLHALDVLLRESGCNSVNELPFGPQAVRDVSSAKGCLEGARHFLSEADSRWQNQVHVDERVEAERRR